MDLASSISCTAELVPATTGILFLIASCLALVLLPRSSIAVCGGPINFMLAEAQALAKTARSDKKP